MTLSVAHSGDIHACQRHHKWTKKALAFVVDKAIARKADVAVLGGDLADHKLALNEPAAVDLVNQVTRLGQAMPTLCAMGTRSHDVPGSMDIFRNIPTRFPIYVAAQPVAVLLQAGEWHEIKEDYGFSPNASGKAGDAVFFVLPGVNRAEPEIMRDGARAYLDRVIAGFAKTAAAAKSHGLPTSIVVHATILGSLTESNHAMVANDWEISLEMLFGSGVDAVMANHIHKFQVWRYGGQTCAYSSSPARLVHGDHNPHGFLMWRVEPGHADFEFVETPTRQLLEIEFDGPPDMADLADLAAQATGDDAVRIRWMVDQEYASDVDKAAIRAMFAHCDTVKLEGTVLPIQSVRAAGISRAATLVDKLGYWCKTTGDEGRLQELTERLAMLQGHDAEEVMDLLLREKGGPLQRQVG